MCVCVFISMLRVRRCLSNNVVRQTSFGLLMRVRAAGVSQPTVVVTTLIDNVSFPRAPRRTSARCVRSRSETVS